jgi:protein arginine kinase activator
MQCPVNGNPCNHPKNVHFMSDINGKKQEAMVCSECPVIKNYGMGQLFGSFDQLFGPLVDPPPPNPSQMIPLPMAASPLLNLFHNIFGTPATAENQTACTGCGFTLHDIRTAGRLGCEKCYESFRDYLEPVIKRSHEGSLQHCGKVPKNLPTFRHHSVEDLKEKLATAVKDERFEDAAVLRDAIKRLEEHIRQEDLSRQQNQTPKTPDS